MRRNAPRIEPAQLDEVQTKRLDLRQHAVERGPIQNTCQQRVYTLQLGHHRLKARQGGRAKVAGDPNRVQTRNLLVHLTDSQDSLGESASPGSSEVKWAAMASERSSRAFDCCGAARPRSTSRVPIVSRSVGARPESPGSDEHDSPCACALRHHCGAIGGQSAGSVTTRIGIPARYAATSSAIRCHAVRKRCSVT